VNTVVSIGSGVEVSNHHPITIFAGINVLESMELALTVAQRLHRLSAKYGFKLVFKASWDKANRTSMASYRGPSLNHAVEIFGEVKSQFGLPIVTDIHEPAQAAQLATVVDVLQIPAFLARQTDLVAAACRTDRPILIKKMQMMSPADALRVVDKCTELGNTQIMLCERGTLFGYGNLIVDMLSFGEIKASGTPIVLDVTHALQTPGSQGASTGGRGHRTLDLALAGVSQSIAGLFVECHPDPSKALCDGPCATHLSEMESLLKRVCGLDAYIKASR
tara:strand:+ start:1339 stop:2169 length:831 start_codon:yes stop_codon:yes gene_type:complete